MSRQLSRVVVTGVGAISCFGGGAPIAWRNLLAGRSGIVAIKEEPFAKIASKVYGKVPLVGQPITNTSGAQIEPFDIMKYTTKSELREIGPACVFAAAATEEALRDANYLPVPEDQRERAGVMIGMCFLDMQEMANVSLESERLGHYNRVSPFFLPRILLNMPAARVSIRFGLKGAQLSTTTACTIGAHSIGDAYRMLRSGELDMVVAGGVEASLNPLVVGGFSKMRALSTRFNDRPHLASRPFDAEHDGFVIAEGCGVLVLERLEHYEQRIANLKSGAKKPRVYAEILGYGVSADAHHITSPAPNGNGARRSMQAALRDAGLSPDDVTSVNCHATSTPAGDSIEVLAVSDLIKSTNNQKQRTVFINGTKGSTGHLIGASGAIESVFSVLQCSEKQIAPCVNLQKADPSVQKILDQFNKSQSAQLKLVGAGDSKPAPWETPKGQRRVMLKNSFGFGGTNASLCFASFD